MPIPRKLDQPREREVALMYLCGIDWEMIGQKYSISEAQIRGVIVGKRSHEWKDPLVDLYHHTDFHQKDFNAAHLYLTFQLIATRHLREDVPHSELVDQRREGPVYEQIRDSIMVPAMERVITETRLDQFVAPTAPLEKLLSAVSPEWRTPIGILTPLFVQRLYEQYKASPSQGRGFGFDKMVDSLIGYVLDRIKYGAAAITPAKKDIIYKQLQSLTPREEHVLKSHFGLDLQEPKTLGQIADDSEVSGDRIRQIKDRALRKLCHPSRGRDLAVAASLITDEEARSYVTNPPPKPAPKLIAELELSFRSANCLNNTSVKTVRELIENWSVERLYKTRNMGLKSMKEIKEVLAEHGMVLREK